MVLDCLANTTELYGTNMFVKFKKKHNLKIPLELGTLGSKYGAYKESGYQMFNGDVEVQRQLLKETIPEKYLEYFDCRLAVINKQIIVPHIDERLLAINFYIQTADATTSFYKIKDPSAPIKYIKETKTSWYREEELEFIDSFHANPGDIWMLDTTHIHGVVCSSPVDRIAYTMDTLTITFTELKEILSDQLESY